MKTHQQIIDEAEAEAMTKALNRERAEAKKYDRDAREEFGPAAALVQEFAKHQELNERSEAGVEYRLEPASAKPSIRAETEKIGIVDIASERLGYVNSDGLINPWPPASGNAALMASILRAMRDPSIDPARMQQWAEIYERIAEKEAERQFNIAMMEAQNEMPKLVKDATNPDTRSKYIRFETMGTAVDPIVRRHGFSESYGTDDSPLEGHYRSICYLSHQAGHTRMYHVDVPIDNRGMKGAPTKTATHGFGSTMSYCRRYLKAMIWNLVIMNEDDDGNGGKESLNQDGLSVQQSAEINQLLKSTGRSLERFLKFKKLDYLMQIRASDFDRVKEEIMAVAKRGEPHKEINVPEVPKP